MSANHNISPYFDQFDKTKNYVKILFVGGKSLQATEVTQIQSTLQNQISAHADHIFENGSIVSGLEKTLKNNINVAVLTSSSTHTNLAVGDTIKGTISETLAKIVHIDTTDAEAAIFYIPTDGGDNFVADDGIEIYSYATDTTTDVSCALKSTDFETTGVLLSINEGFVYYDGYFLHVDSQTTVVDKTGMSPTKVVGLQVSEEIITFVEDPSLVDPASGLENYGQDGAHRFKATMTLETKLTTDVLDETFVELAKIKDGAFVENIKVPLYSDLEDTLARRTYDESGNYTVRPFKLNVTNSAKINDLTVLAQTIDDVNEVDNFSIYKTGDNELTLELKRTATGAEVVGVAFQLEVNGNIITDLSYNGTNTITKEGATIDFDVLTPNTSNTYWFDNGVVSVNRITHTADRQMVLTFTNDLDVNTIIRFKANEVITEDDIPLHLWIGDKYLGKNLPPNKEWYFPMVDANTDENLNISLDSGKAYIQGYEYETITKNNLTIPRARDTQVVQNFGVGVSYGNYCIVDNLNGWFATDVTEEVHLADVVSASVVAGDIIGTAKIRQLVLHATGEYRFYLFDIKMDTGRGFTEVQSILSDSVVTNASKADIADSGKSGTTNLTKLFDSHLNGLVFPINQSNIKTLSPTGSLDITYTTKVVYDATFNSGVASINAGTGRQFISGNDSLNFHIIDTSDGSIVLPDSVDFGGDPQSATFNKTGLAASVKIIASVRINTATQANKTLVSNSTFDIVDSSSTYYNSDTRKYTLRVSDGYRLVSIVDTNGNNITSKFTFDNGQKDDFYDHCGVVLNKTSSIDVGDYPLTVTFDYFTHSGSGFFSVDSYSGIPYGDIPAFISPNTGQVYHLRDSIDFRPRREDNLTTSTAIDPVVGGILLPASINSNILTSDYEFYLPRIDKIALSKDRQFIRLAGISALHPISPKDSDDAMTLYTLKIPAYTGNAKDVGVKYHENRRYTMREIGSIEKRVENLEYYTTLSLLEKDTIATEVTDNNGNNRFKNGILVDSFTGHNVGDVGNFDYKCAIDTQNQFLRSPFVSRHARMLMSSTTLTTHGNTSIGEFLLMPHTTENLITQPYASKIENVNPYMVVKYVGNMSMNPAIDSWVDTINRPDVVVNLEGNNDAIEFLQNSVNDVDGAGFGTTWNDWETTWTGVEDTVPTETITDTNTPIVFPRGWSDLRPPDDISVRLNGILQEPDWMGIQGNAVITPRTIQSGTGGTGTTSGGNTGVSTRTGTRTTFSPNTITENIGTRIVDITVVPFMRKNVVKFTAKGLRPNRTLYAFFDDVNVDEYITPDASVVFDGTSKEFVVQEILKTMGDPLVTDSNGEVTGTFSIPNGVFRTGERNFTLIDERNNYKPAATTYTTQKYISSGLVQTREDTVISTRVMELTQEVITEERTISEPTQPALPVVVTPPEVVSPTFSLFEDSLDLWVPPQRIDPLAQTIYVDGVSYPNGIYLSDVDLYFNTKSTSNVPVRLEIRPVVNGYPSSSKVVPLSVVIKSPSDVNTSNDGSVATKFTFDVPVYLSANTEYAIVVLADSQEYEVYVSEMGQPDILTGSRISRQPHLGSLFKSQNGATWTATQNEDMKMVVNKCVFTTGQNYTVNYANADILQDNKYSLIKFVSENIEFAGTSPITWGLKTTDTLGNTDTDFMPIENNKNIAFTEQKKIVSGDTTSMVVQGTMSTTSRDVAPLIDTSRQYTIYVENVINDTTNDEELSNGGDATAKYITRRVNLEDGLDGNYIKVFLGAYKPDVTNLKVYYRVLSGEDYTNFDDSPYTEMVQETDINTYSTGQNDYKELVFIPPTNEITYTNNDGVTFDTYRTFAIKIVMTSSNPAIVPRVKDLRVISTAP